MHDNRDCRGVFYSLFDGFGCHGNFDGFEGLNFQALGVVEGNIDGVEAFCLSFHGGADSFCNGVHVLYGGEFHRGAYGEGPFFGFDVDGEFCLFLRAVGFFRIGGEGSGVDGDLVIERDGRIIFCIL